MELKRLIGDKPGISLSLNNLGIVALEQKDYSSAKRYFMDGLAMEQEIGSQHALLYDLIGLAGVAVNIGSVESNEREVQRAVLLASAVETHMTQLGANMEPIIRRLFDGTVAVARSLLGEETFDRLWKEGQSMNMEEAIACAREK
jgi:hypothetical protein